MRKEVKDILDYSRYCIKGNSDRIPFINMLIYYAQYLSIEDQWKPLLWSNFFNVNGVPYLAPLMIEPSIDYSELDNYPIDENNYIYTHYISLALDGISNIHKQLGFDGVKSFISGICDMQGRPSIDPYHMLYYALKGKDKIDRTKAKQCMTNDEANKKYTKTVVNPDTDDEEEIECTKYAS